MLSGVDTWLVDCQRQAFANCTASHLQSMASAANTCTSAAVGAILCSLLLSSLQSSTSATAASPSDYPLCPLTGLPPSKPNTTFSRCLGANQYSCCADCSDIRYGLTAVAAKGSTVLGSIAPALVGLLVGSGKDFQVSLGATLPAALVSE